MLTEMSNFGKDESNIGAAISSAVLTIFRRAVELDQQGRYTASLTCYEQGLTLLMEIMKNSSDEGKKKYMRQKLEEYMGRAEKIKKLINEKKLLGNYREQVIIEADSKGNSYKSVFGRFLDEEVQTIEVEDPYIRSFHQVIETLTGYLLQCQNFLKFCELSVLKCPNLQSIVLITTLDPSSQAARDQQKCLDTLKKSLLTCNINLSTIMSETLHDRTIRLSNGWIIKIGRGLDYFKAPESKMSLGVFAMDLRPCHQTTVDIFHSNQINIRKS